MKPKICHPDLRDAMFHAVIRLSKKDPGLIPTQLLFPWTPLYRAVSAKHCDSLLVDPPTLTQKVADGARTPRDKDLDDNRWSGKGSDAVWSQAGLYLSLNSGALSAEVSHYRGAKMSQLHFNRKQKQFDVAHAFTKIAPDLRLILFVLNNVAPLSLVDFSKASLQGPFFQALDADPVAGDLLLKYVGTSNAGPKSLAAARSPEDYSAARGIALGLASLNNPSYDGILVQTARDNPAVRDDGDNLVLFGDNRVPHTKVSVAYVVLPTLSKNQQMTLTRIQP